jgi:hypothetical protein
MREDIPEWLGKPPLRGTEEWEAWLAKWRQYARVELRDQAADDPDFDFGLLSTEERWRVALRLEIREQFLAGRQGGRTPMIKGKRISDIHHAGIIAWMVGHSMLNPLPDDQFVAIAEWATSRENPTRRRLAHGVRYGFLDGLGGEAAAPSWSTPDYVAAYEAAWEVGNSIAIENDPRG